MESNSGFLGATISSAKWSQDALFSEDIQETIFIAWPIGLTLLDKLKRHAVIVVVYQMGSHRDANLLLV